MRPIAPLSLLFLLAALPAAAADKDMKAFYQANCAVCHGADGSAQGPDWRKLKGRDFTDPQWQAKKSDAELAATIRKGIFFGKAMPSFKDKLTEAEALRLVREVIRPFAEPPKK